MGQFSSCTSAPTDDESRTSTEQDVPPRQLIPTESDNTAIEDDCGSCPNLSDISDRADMCLPTETEKSTEINYSSLLEQLPKKQQYKLSLVLLQTDRDMLVRGSRGRAKELTQSITILMTRLVQSLAERDPIFKGDLIPGGSFYEDTKINQPNQFDFSLVIRPDFCRFKLDEVYFGKEELGHSCVTSAAGCSTVTNDVLTAQQLKQRLTNITDKVMMKIALPEDIEHGGLQRPQYSGSRGNGPAFLLQFVHRNSLEVNVDLTLAVPISTDEDETRYIVRFMCARDYLTEFLYRKGFTQEILLLPMVSNVWICSNSINEQVWFNQFTSYSTPKTTLRLCKIITAKYTNIDEKDATLPRKCNDEVNVETGYLKTNGEDDQNVRSNCICEHSANSEHDVSLHFVNLRCDHLRWLQVLEGEDLPHLAENVGSLSFFQSYVFKKIILTMLAADCVEENNEENSCETAILPRLVEVFSTIFTLLEDKCSLCQMKDMRNELSTVWEEDEDILTRKSAIAEGRPDQNPGAAPTLSTKVSKLKQPDPPRAYGEECNQVPAPNEQQMSYQTSDIFVDGVTALIRETTDLSIAEIEVQSSNKGRSKTYANDVPMDMESATPNDTRTRSEELQRLEQKQIDVYNNPKTITIKNIDSIQSESDPAKVNHIHYRGKLYPSQCTSLLRTHKYGREKLRAELKKLIQILLDTGRQEE